MASAAASSRRRLAAILLLFCLFASESAACPEDSMMGEDGECKCVSPCPKHDCQPGLQPVRVREASPETPGLCCPLYECRNQETVNLLAPEDTVHICVDGSGQPRKLGEQWQGEDPCKNCTCEATGSYCHIAMCQTCAEPLPLRPGECCPRCADFLPTYRPTCSRVLAFCDLRCPLDRDERGCLICRCRTNVQNEVHKEQPDDSKTADDAAEEGDYKNRPRPAVCPDGQRCERPCPHGYRKDEYGCPSCRCSPTCLDERNVTRPEGASWSVEPCRSCKCEAGGHVRCNETVCSVACSEPLPPPPGQCCPQCPTQALDEFRGWGTVPIVLIVMLALLCVLLMVHLVRGRFRARLAPSEVSFAGFPQQYYKCVPVYETHVPVLRHAEKIAPL